MDGGNIAIFTDGQAGTLQETAGDFSAWTATGASAGCTTEISHANPHHGTHDFHLELDGSFADDYCYCNKTIAEQTTCYGRVYVQFDVLPANNTEYIWFMNLSNTVGGYIQQAQIYNSAGTVIFRSRYLSGGGLLYLTTAKQVVLGTRYCVELYSKIDAAVGQHIIYIDGVNEAATAANLDTDGRGNVNQFRFFLQAGVALAADATYDCVSVDSSYNGLEAAGGLMERCKRGFGL